MERLDVTVRKYMNSIGASQVDNRYARFLQFAIDGVKEINREYKNVVKVKRIDVSDVNLIASLPVDYIDYLSISVCWQGQLFALGLNDNMCPPHFDSCGNIVVDGYNTLTAEQMDVYWWNNNYNSDGFFIGQLYGIGGGGNAIGKYNVYKSQGYIAFQNVSQQFDEIILQYIGDKEMIDEEHVIDEAYSQTIQAWIHWKHVQRLKSYSPGDKMDAERTYYNEKRKAALIQKAFTIPELVNAVRQGYRSSPKI